MEKSCLLRFLGIFTILAEYGSTYSANDGEETAYILYLPPLLDTHTDRAAPRHTSLLMAPSGQTRNVTISLPLMPQLVPLTIQLHVANWTEAEVAKTWLDMSREQEKGLGMYVHSTSQFLLSVSLTSRCHASTAPLLPVTQLDTEYIVTSFKPRGFIKTVLSMVGTYNDTSLNISQPSNHRTSSAFHFSRENEIMQINLDAFETVSYDSSHDITGFRITSDKPVAVFVQIELQYNSVDTRQQLLLQLPAVSHWGCTYVHYITHTNAIYRITASQLGTNVRFSTRIRSGTLHLSYSVHSDIHVTKDDAYITLESDNAVLVTMLQQTVCGLEDKDCCISSSLDVVPPVSQWRSDYTFSVVHNTNITLALPAHSEQVLELDEQVLVDSYNQSLVWQPVSGLSQDYVAVHVAVTAGQHTLHHPDGLTFLALGQNINFGYFQHSTSVSNCEASYKPQGYEVVQAEQPKPQPESPAPAQDRSNSKVPIPPVVYRIEKLGASQRPQVVNFHEQEVTHDQRDFPSGPSVIAVVASLSVAVFFVIVCIVGFVLAEFWGRREVIRRVKVAPYGDPY